ncbi:MAG: NACHT domain-containing protein [Chloroflexi bacterium]|nr:NACHT domain-containing protein [Chloroflexota bacterium]
MDQSSGRVSQPGFQDIEQRYRQQVIKHYNRLTLTGLPERDPGLHGVPLEKVFVKLNVETRQAARLDPAVQRELERLQRELVKLEKEGGRGNRRQAQELQARIERLEAEARKPRIETLSVAEALQQYQRLAVVGGPGSGKTTLTRWLALTFAQNRQAEPDRLGPAFSQPRLPILLELRRFAPHLSKHAAHPIPDLSDEIATYISGHAYYAGAPKAFIVDALSSGRCLLLIDGLDEVADLNIRRNLVDALNALLQRSDGRYGENLCIVTSRPHGYRDIDLGAGFQTARVKPFEPEDVHLFIRHWYETAYGADAEEEAQTLIEAIDQNDRVQDLATNPLLCTIIAIVYRNNRVLPNRRVELYLKCSEALLDTWERNKAIRDSGLIGKYDWQTKIELLAPLAYWLHSETERLAAPEEAFVEQLTHVLMTKGLETGARAKEEARRFLAAIRDRSGLLQGRGDGSLEFAHRTFQEYLAARHIAAQPDPDHIDLVMPHLHEAWWREVHLLTIGHLGSGSDGAEKASKLLLYILRLYKPPLWLLRARRASVWNILAMFLAARVPKWQLERRLAWVLAREFEFAAAGFQDCTPLGLTDAAKQALREEAESLLIQIVRDPGRQEKAHNVSEAAASSLVQLGQVSPQVITALTHALGDSDWPVREAAASSLGRLGQASPQVIDALIQALGHSDWPVREAAASSLGQLGQASPQVIDALIQALGHSDRPVRRAAASSLGQLGQASPQVIDALIQALDDSAYSVRRAAASILVQLGIENEKTLRHALIALNRRLHDIDDDVRRAALEAIRNLLDGRPIPGYHWQSLRKKQARRQRLKRWGAGLGLGFVVILMALVATWLLTDAPPNSFLVRFLTALGALVGFAAGVTTILGWTLREHWRG